MLPIDVGIGETLTFPVDLDTSAFDNDYALPSTGIVMRMAVPGSQRAAFTCTVEVTDIGEGNMSVTMDAVDTIKLIPGAWVGQIIDTAGPFRLATIPFSVDYLIGVLPEDIKHLYIATANRIGENVVVVRGEDYTGDNALFFQVSREVEDLATVFAVIDGERYNATVPNATTTHIVKVELDYTDTEEFGFTASQFLIVEVADPELDPDVPEVSSVNTLYDAIITVREG